MLGTYGAKPPKEAIPQARDAAIKALALDNNLAEALEWLDRADQDRADWMVFLRVDPRFNSPHSDQKFIELLDRMNL